MIPIATVSGLEFGLSVAFAVITETVFAWPGMGKLLIDLILLLDRPVVVAYLMIIVVFFFVVLNLLVDLLYSVLDPRVRLRKPRDMSWNRRSIPPSSPSLRRSRRRRSSASCQTSARTGSPCSAWSSWLSRCSSRSSCRLSPLQNPFDIGSLDLLDAKSPPGTVSSDGKFTNWLGTDGQALDMMSAIFNGMRTSLFVGFVSVITALGIGVVVGLVAAYVGGRTDAFLMRIVDIMLSFPAILVALILLSVLGKGIDKVLVALILVQWAYFARAAPQCRAGRAQQGICRGRRLPRAAARPHRVPAHAAPTACRR